MNTATYLKLEKHINTATYLPQRQPRAWWTVLLRGLAPRAVMAAGVGLLMGSPVPVYAHGSDASLVHACIKKSGGQPRIVRPGARCRAKEKAVDWSITGPAGLASPPGSAGVAGPPGPAFPITCPPDSVLTGTTCIDTYEASVWETTDAALIAKIQDGTVTLVDLSAARAVQRGASSDDYGDGCPDTGNGCVDFYAVSIPGVTPAAFLTQFQAAAAARNSGKRLPSNAEWQAAALGTPDPGVSAAGSEDCNTADGDGAGGDGALVPTGSRENCFSDAGAFDLVGNLNEWVADWVPLSKVSLPCPAELFRDTGDLNCVFGASETSGPGALLRGRDFGSGASAGVFAVDGGVTPSSASIGVGFRAAR